MRKQKIVQRRPQTQSRTTGKKNKKDEGKGNHEEVSSEKGETGQPYFDIPNPFDRQARMVLRILGCETVRAICKGGENKGLIIREGGDSTANHKAAEMEKGRGKIRVTMGGRGHRFG